jgi:glycosyltransferase involved in cell wall biosynthesis
MVEATLCARPVVATDVAGHAEIVEDGVTGFLADAATVASIERALERMWARRNELERMGEAGSRKIRGLVPADPIRTFSEKIKAIAREPRAVAAREAGRDGLGAIATRASR